MPLPSAVCQPTSLPISILTTSPPPFNRNVQNKQHRSWVRDAGYASTPPSRRPGPRPTIISRAGTGNAAWRGEASTLPATPPCSPAQSSGQVLPHRWHPPAREGRGRERLCRSECGCEARLRACPDVRGSWRLLCGVCWLFLGVRHGEGGGQATERRGGRGKPQWAGGPAGALVLELAIIVKHTDRGRGIYVVYFQGYP